MEAIKEYLILAPQCPSIVSELEQIALNSLRRAQKLFVASWKAIKQTNAINLHSALIHSISLSR